MPIRTRLIGTIVELDAFVPAWREFLERRAADHTVYQHPTFVQAELAARAGTVTPLVLVAEDQTGIVCVAPFYVREGPFSLHLGGRPFGSVRLRLLKLWGDDPVCARGEERPECLRAVLEALSALVDRFDLLLLERLPMTGTLSRCFAAGASTFGFRLRPTSSERQTIRRLRMAGNFDDYLGRLHSRTRYNLLRRRRLLLDFPGKAVRMVRASGPKDVGGFLEQVERVRACSWQAATYGDQAGSRDSERERLAAMAREGWLRGYVLECADGPIAFVLGYQYRDTYYHDETAYDQAWAKLGPGTVLNLLVIEDLFQQRQPVLLDFGFGENEYKRIFGNEEVEACTAFVVHQRQWRGRCLVTCQCTLNRAGHALRSVARRLRVDRGLQRWTRHRRTGEKRPPREDPLA